jgi:tetrahydromethanopterin S-methyltransferase subunit D
MTDIQRVPQRTPANMRYPGAFREQLAMIAEQCGGEVVLLPNYRATLIGVPGEVGQMLAAIRAAGRFVSASALAPTGVPGQFFTNVRLAPLIQPPPYAVRQGAPRRKLPRWAFWSIIGGVVAFVGGLVWLAVAIATVIAEHLAAASVVAIGLAVLAAVLVGNRAGGTTITGTFQGKIH